MKIRAEIRQGISDARLLEIDIINFLNNKADWGDNCSLTDYETKHSFNGYQVHYFSIGINLYSKDEFNYKLYHEVLFAAVEAFVYGKLPYWMFGGSTPIQVSSPKIKLKNIGEDKQICFSFITKAN